MLHPERNLPSSWGAGPVQLLWGPVLRARLRWAERCGKGRSTSFHTQGKRAKQRSQEPGPVQEGAAPSAHAVHGHTAARHTGPAPLPQRGRLTLGGRSDRPLRLRGALKTTTASTPCSCPPHRQRWDPDTREGVRVSDHRRGAGGDRRLSATHQGLRGPCAACRIFMGHRGP